jgi:hypothetical protein
MLANGWVITIIGLLVPLTNGGAAGAVWTYVLAIIGSAFGKSGSSSSIHGTTELTIEWVHCPSPRWLAWHPRRKMNLENICVNYC